MKIENGRNREYLNETPITIGLLGIIGSGKSTFAKTVSEKLNINCLSEDFGENPYLEDFYSKPHEYSFISQMWFLMQKINQLKTAKRGISQIIDPEVQMDLCYAKALNKIHFMSNKEYELYEDEFNVQTSSNDIIKPDIYIWINPKLSVARERIIKRGRPFELKMLANYPHYLTELRNVIPDFASNSLSKSIISIDSSSDDFINDNAIASYMEKIKTCLNKS